MSGFIKDLNSSRKRVIVLLMLDSEGGEGCVVRCPEVVCAYVRAFIGGASFSGWLVCTLCFLNLELSDRKALFGEGFLLPSCFST